MSETSTRKKTLTFWDLFFFSFAAIFLIDTLPASAAIGPASISWWIICAIIYFLPYGLISAELGTTYPEQGGLYVWTKRAFGSKWAARTTWFYWVNVALWMPAVYIIFAGVFAQMFFPDMSLWGQVIVGIIITWITVWFNIKSLEVSKWVPNIGAITKMFVVLAMVIAAVIALTSKGSANTINWQTIKPKLDAGLFFFPVIIYNLSGFELMSSAAEEMKDPTKDIPKAVISSGIIITLLYLATTLALLITVPLDNLSLVTGIIDMLDVVFGSIGVSNSIITALGIMIMFTFFANMVTWTLGANRAAVEAAEAGEFPKVFGIIDEKNQTPKGAAIITGLVSTLVFICYGMVAATSEELFWSMFAFSSIIFLLPYAILFPVFIKLRKIDKDIERPYKVPGSPWFVNLIAIIAELFVIQSIVFFIWVPGQPIDWGFAVPVLIGTIITLAVGEIIVHRYITEKPELPELEECINN